MTAQASEVLATAAPIVVRPPTGTGGRRVTVRGQILGLAHSDDHVVKLLRAVGLPSAQDLLDDPLWVTWRGGRAHRYDAA
ncbi:hypothetical protein [Streptomyces sp. NPDC047123]|uniref:hypothetical protein n=1 Tax=Streptomyces sp. NPDC047123 TaxID=3155622 RepID=UPI0033F9CDA0